MNSCLHIPRTCAVTFVVYLLFALSLTRSSGGAVPEDVLEAQQRRIDTIAKVSKSTIAVFGPGDSGGGGSAVVITPDGYALTNFHVAKPVGHHLKCGMDDGVFYDAVIVGVDPTGDIALIKLVGRDDFPAAEIGDSDTVRAGDWCIVSGNPFLLATDFRPTITYGIVSGVHRYQYPSGTLLEYADCIQTDAAINPGNSGGPLWNSDGKLIGINGRGSFEKRNRVNVGVGYAISINQVKNFMGYLRSGRVVDHATLGATVSTDDDGRVVVSNILSTCDAYRRGLRYGDEIVAFGGRNITSTNGFKNVLGTFPKGWQVPLSFVKQGERVDTYARLSGVHAGEELLAKMELGGIAPPRPNGEKEPERRKPPKPSEDGEAPRSQELPALEIASPADKKQDEKIAKLYEERRGYANFFFNKLEQNRVWEQAKKLGDFSEQSNDWLVEGKLDGKAFQIALGDRLADGRIDRVFQEVDFDLELQTQLSPRRTGGLLLGLHQWRRLLVEGPEKFGSVFYLGTAPLYGLDSFHGLADVLVGTYDVVETRFYFEPTSGKLLAMEMYPDIDVDPCQLFFRENEKEDGRMMPRIIDVRFGDEPIRTLQVDRLEFGKHRNFRGESLEAEGIE